MPSYDPMAPLSPEERAAMTQLVTALVGRAANRKERLALFTDLATALTREDHWFWQAALVQNRKQELVIHLVNGRVSALHLNTKL